MSLRVLEKPLNFPQLSLGIIKLRGKYKLEDSTGHQLSTSDQQMYLHV